ncbi:MAG: hypothetical protein H6767_03355 [Candidatus Peribacteria bacterium]|nr:MAG: hypothetical protein H6767_03355 [Candidatus Peribacteria bacterium]
MRATEDLLEVQVERDNTLKGLLSPNKQVKDVNLGKAFDDFVTFVQRYIGGEVISTGFSGHKQLDNKQPEFLRYEQEYGITIAHLITYLFEGTGEELRYHFY